MSKDRWYVEAIGGSLDDNNQPRQMAAIYDHRGKLVCDMVWLEDAAAIGRAVNAHDELVAELSDILRSIEGGGDIVTFQQVDVDRYRALIAKAMGNPA